MGRKLLLTIKVYFWMSISGLLLSIILSAFAVFNYFQEEPNVAKAFKERVAHDLKFTQAWVSKHKTEQVTEQCRVLRQPMGYRCFYYDTFTEMELRRLSFVGYLDLAWRGMILIIGGDKELANQPSVVGGTPAEDNKVGQMKHWMSYVLQRATDSFIRSELVDGVRYATGSLPTKEMRLKAGMDDATKKTVMESFKHLDINELKKTINERNEAINQLEKMMDEP